MPCAARASARLPVPLAPPSPLPLGDQRRCVLAQPAARRPQLGGGGDSSSSGGRRARGAEVGGCGRRVVRLAFSFLRGHGRAPAAGPPPAAPRRMPAAPPPAPPASPHLWPRYPRSGGSVADSGVASASSWRTAALGSAAGMLRAQGPGAAGRRGRQRGGAFLSPLPGARAGARVPRPRHCEGAIGKLQRRPAERPPRDPRRRRVFLAPPRGRALGAELEAPRLVRAGALDPARREAREVLTSDLRLP